MNNLNPKRQRGDGVQSTFRFNSEIQSRLSFYAKAGDIEIIEKYKLEAQASVFMTSTREFLDRMSTQ